ncbi:hypothetical protein [Prosthecobacter debontii]|uniref:hypothetical protein n=1 Tax=Prosthecobacter debontii TaxID=48467 RepID=UPI001115B188|nr:hypothetical protein [Prosthecobacter debontii]
MKNLIAILAIVTGIGFTVPVQSTARDWGYSDRRVVGRYPCGEPIYAVYTVTKRDKHGRVLERGWKRTSSNHSHCRACYGGSGRGRYDHHDDYDYRPPIRVPFFFGR